MWLKNIILINKGIVYLIYVLIYTWYTIHFNIWRSAIRPFAVRKRTAVRLLLTVGLYEQRGKCFYNVSVQCMSGVYLYTVCV